MSTVEASASASAPAARDPWAPRFLCYSFKSPIVLSDGVVTSCTLDHRGRNRVGSIHEDDFDTLIQRYGRQRLDTMAAPLLKPLCHACYTRLPRWRDQQVPRTGWLDEQISDERKRDYRALFDPARLSLNIELSSACNLRCHGCSLADPAFRFSRGTPNIDLDHLMAWLDGHLRQIVHVRLYHMGETWLHPRWFEFCRYLKAGHPAMTLFTSTNGMPLDDERKLEQVVDSGIDHVMFSIHGTTQASTEAYMGKAFRADVAFEAARRLAQLRRQRGAPLYLSWKYLLFDWNDSDGEIERAKQLCDEIGFDELHFSITSQPAPSRRYALDSAGWAAMRQACAAASRRAAAYQQTTPMTAIYPGQARRRQAIAWQAPPAEDRPAPGTQAAAVAPVLILPGPAEALVQRGRALLDEGLVLQAVTLLQQGTAKPGAAQRKALGDALLAAGRPDDAAAAFESSLQLNPAPRSEQLHLGLARALRACGRLAEAEAAYEQALRLRERGSPGLYGEDVYLELRATSLALGHAEMAANAWRMWLESSWLADTVGRTAYCPIAKNACTFMKAALAHNSVKAEAYRGSGQDPHVFTRTRINGLRLGDRRLLDDPRYFVFVLLRDPCERLASAYGYNFVRPLRWRDVPDLPGRPLVNAVHLRQGREPDWKVSISFDEFVREVVRRDDADLDHHWRPQSAFFEQAGMFRHVGCVERLDATLAALTEARRWRFDFDAEAQRNALPRASLARADYARQRPQALAALPGFPRAAELFSDELRELVQARYARDLLLHAEALDGAGPVYPTGGALALQHGGKAQEKPAPKPVPAAAQVRDARSLQVQAALPVPGHQPLPQPAAPDVMTTLVAAPDGAPGGDGGGAAPLPLGLALQRAFVLQSQGQAVRVWLLDGVYRESVRAVGRRDASAPLIIEAQPGARPVLSGADIVSDWHRHGEVWTGAWTTQRDPVPAPPDHGKPWLVVPPLMLRREMAWADGRRLRQVLDPARLDPGTFFVDDVAQTMLLRPPPGTRSIALARRCNLLELVGAAAVTLRGIVFRHEASGAFEAGTGALRLNACERITVEDCVAEDNNHRGVQIDGHCRDITLRRVLMNHNGCTGLLASRVQGLRLEGCETSFNNWRGAWAGCYRRAPCGLKVWRSRDVHIAAHRALHNHATGLWIDEDNRRVTIERAEVLGNRRGIHVEAGVGPVEIVGCSVVGNRQEPVADTFRWPFGSGIVVTHAQDVTVRACLIAGNDVAQLGVRDDPAVRRLRLADGEPAQELRCTGLTIEDNTVLADSHGAWMRLPSAGFDEGRFRSTLRSRANRFVGGPRADQMLQVTRRGDSVETQRMDLAQWRACSGQDMASSVDGSSD